MYILEQLIYIVGVAKHHMQIFLDPIMQMLKDLWHESCEKRTLINLLKLIGELAGTICAVLLLSRAKFEPIEVHF